MIELVVLVVVSVVNIGIEVVVIVSVILVVVISDGVGVVSLILDMDEVKTSDGGSSKIVYLLYLVLTLFFSTSIKLSDRYYIITM